MLMVVVAVMALVLGTVRIWNMRSSYVQKAAEYALEERDERKILQTLERHIARLDGLLDETSKRLIESVCRNKGQSPGMG
jgi:hypothetical protein